MTNNTNSLPSADATNPVGANASNPASAGASNAANSNWGDDYSAGTNVGDWGVGPRIDYFKKRVEHVNRLRSHATYVAVAVLICLLAALWVTIKSFTKQIDKVTPAVSEFVPKAKASSSDTQSTLVAGQAVPAAAASASASQTAQAAKPGTGTQSNPPTVTHSVGPASVTTSVSVDMSSIGNSIVAVVTVLVISIAALVIVLLKTAYALSTSDSESKAESNSLGLPLPGAELLKAAAEGLTTVVKAVGKKD